MTEETLFPPFPVPPDLEELARKREWPDGLVQRALNVRVPADTVRAWLGVERADLVQQIEQMVSRDERLVYGTLRGREANHGDDRAFADLWANAPEQIGDWEVTVERSPNAFAQFGLQERVSIPVLEDRGLLVASVVWSMRSTFVGGRKLLVLCSQGLRVRKQMRRAGYGGLVRQLQPHISRFPTNAEYFYIRSQNFTAVNHISSTNPQWFTAVPKRDDDVPGLTATVQQYPARAFDGDAGGIRTARPGDVAACVALINRTYDGLDLFRPLTEEFLDIRLHGGAWGQRPRGWAHVYGFDDFYVLEDAGLIVACAGLWDRGRDVRERWRNASSGEERVVEATTVLDAGFAHGREDALAQLIRSLLGRTHQLGRNHLMVCLDTMPGVEAVLADLDPIPETRGLSWRTWGPDGQMQEPDPPLTKPYTDLSYW